MFSDIITLSFVSTSRARSQQLHRILKHYCVPSTVFKILWQKKAAQKTDFYYGHWSFIPGLFCKCYLLTFHASLIVTLTAPELHIWLMSGPRHRTEGEIDIRTHFYFRHFPNLPNMFSWPRVCREEFCREQTNVSPACAAWEAPVSLFIVFCLRRCEDVMNVVVMKVEVERLLQTLWVCAGSLWQHFSKKLSLR